jgi:hypothetical protein
LDLELNNTTSQNSPNSKERRATANARNYPEENIDEMPADPDEESQHSKELKPANNVIRMSSEDTHDTPQVSNVDPHKSPSRVPTPTEAERRMDDLCQKYFNTPKVIHSTASLGDSITPLDSPVDLDVDVDDEEGANSRCDQPSNDAADEAREMLQLPTMERSESSAYRSQSKSSLLYGDGLSDEKKEDDAQDAAVLNLSPDNASVKIGQQEVEATISITDSAPGKIMIMKRPSEMSAYQTLNADSSFSSVSSFAEVARVARTRNSNLTNYQNVDQGKSITPHPFFWRSHPKVTVTSYDTQLPKNRIRQVVPKIEAVHSADFNMSDTSPEQRDLHDDSGEGGTEGEYAPYLHPAVVRKLWMESKPFQLQVNSNWHANSHSDRHPQGPPPARSHPFVQSLASFAKIPANYGWKGNPSSSK